MEEAKSSAMSMILLGGAFGVIGVLLYQKYRKPVQTVNDRLAGLSVDLSQAIKQGADQGISCKELYATLLKGEAQPMTTVKKPTPDKPQL